MLPNLSTCKSPQQMFGALAKTYYAQKRNIDPSKIVSVSIMPCTAKKYEADRPEMRSSGYKDIDFVLTTRELAVMIKQAGIDFRTLEEDHYDSVMGDLNRCCSHLRSHRRSDGSSSPYRIRDSHRKSVPFKNLNIMPVRGMEGVKEATIKIEGTTEEWRFLEGAELKVAIAHGLVNANKTCKGCQHR